MLCLRAPLANLRLPRPCCSLTSSKVCMNLARASLCCVSSSRSSVKWWRVWAFRSRGITTRFGVFVVRLASEVQHGQNSLNILLGIAGGRGLGSSYFFSKGHISHLEQPDALFGVFVCGLFLRQGAALNSHFAFLPFCTTSRSPAQNMQLPQITCVELKS